MGPKTGCLLRPRRTPFSGHLGPRRKALSPCAPANDGKAFCRTTHRAGVSGFGTEATPKPPPPPAENHGEGDRLLNVVTFPTSHFADDQAPKRAERSRCQRTALGPGPVAPVTASTAPHRPGAADGPPEPALLSTPRGSAGTLFCLGHPFPQGGKSRLVSPCVSIKPAGRRSAVWRANHLRSPSVHAGRLVAGATARGLRVPAHRRPLPPAGAEVWGRGTDGF